MRCIGRVVLHASPESAGAPQELLPVRWGDARLLVRTERLPRFGRAAATGEALTDASAGWLWRGGPPEELAGLPALPESERHHLPGRAVEQRCREPVSSWPSEPREEDLAALRRELEGLAGRMRKR